MFISVLEPVYVYSCACVKSYLYKRELLVADIKNPCLSINDVCIVYIYLNMYLCVGMKRLKDVYTYDWYVYGHTSLLIRM